MADQISPASVAPAGTSGVGLRRLAGADAWAFYECLNVVGGGGFNRPRSMQEAVDLIVHLNSPGTRERVICLAIVDGGDRYLGHLVIDRNPPPNHGHASVGMWLDPQWQNRGFGTTALALAIVEAQTKDQHLNRLDAVCLPTNLGMRRVLMKNGFARMALMEAQQFFDGRFQDMDLWSRRIRDRA